MPGLSADSVIECLVYLENILSSIVIHEGVYFVMVKYL